MKLVKKHFYDSLLFHRVIKNFMIQGGDPNSKHAAPGDTTLGEGDVGYTIPAEFNPKLFHKKGVLAAARDDNPARASSGCQFYIVQGKKFTDSTLNVVETKRLKHKIPEYQRDVYKTTGGTPHLDQGYTVFGEVIKGQEVIDKIAAEPTDKRDRPINDMRMKIRMKKRFLFF
jgi:peptidyl-prolyl cis-trans isomerase B (cyclophilin B)